MMNNNENQHIKPGRPRSEKARTAILAAARALALEQDYNATSLQAIAARAGVGRQTIYRWWPSKIELYLDVLVDAVPADTLTPSKQQPALLAFLRHTFATLGGEIGTISVDLLIDVSHNADKQKDIYQKYIMRRRQYVRSLLLNAAAEQKKTFVVPVDIVTDMVIGLLWYRLIHHDQALNKSAANDVYQSVLHLLR